MLKTFVHFFTIADYEEEEVWLREKSRSGWKLARITLPCFYTFESCEPQDTIYRLDYKNSGQTEEYLQMIRDFGWEHCGQCAGWLYFRKPADMVEAEQEGELFSDDASRADMVSHVVKTRLVPLCFIFLFCLIPNMINMFRMQDSGWAGVFLGGLLGALFLLYVYLITYCGIKLKRIGDRYRKV